MNEKIITGDLSADGKYVHYVFGSNSVEEGFAKAHELGADICIIKPKNDSSDWNGFSTGKSLS